MVFQIPEGLAPETYPMAWLVGSWRGAGVLEYEGIEAAAYLHELTIDNADNGPYLRIESRVWIANEPGGAVDKEEMGARAYAKLSKDFQWSALNGFLRVSPTATSENGTILEGTSSNPAGHAMTWAGIIKGPQLQLMADAIAATPTATDYTGARIMAGLVESDLFYAYDMAAFGEPLSGYMAGRLSRIYESAE